ncbi:MAG: M20 family metallopeptidase [Anaerolineales bacterium]|jgi:predicted dipeptidase|nr:M20 family metallopeptidase [Anaerolineales bacterium]
MIKIPDLPALLEQEKDPLLEAVKELARIPSILQEAETGAPFGRPIAQALSRALSISASLGFRTMLEPDGYYGYAEIGQGEELVAILGHVDVVPAGSLADWRQDPFDPQITDGILYGRGVQDDKGPTLAALFGAHALMQAGIAFNKRLRFIFGTDEENLWRCMKRYLAQEEIPTSGFTPDAKFPLIYAEKGLLQATLEAPTEQGIHLSGGSAFNAVADSAVYMGVAAEKLRRQVELLRYDYQSINGGVQVIGKAAHAQVPEEGVNAICRLAIALHSCGVHSPAIDFLAQEIGEDPYARKIFGDVQDEDTGRLKFNVGMIESGEVERISLDIRIPASVEKQKVVEKLVQSADKYGLKYQQRDWLAPIYIPRQSDLVKTLMDVYRQVTGDYDSQPETSGGATYARAMPNCVAFGAVFPGRPKVEHQPNEHIRLDDLYTAMQIYALAIYALTR